MGRHSAPDDDADDVRGAVAVDVVPDAGARTGAGSGRHARPDDVAATDVTAEQPAVAGDAPVATAEAPDVPVPPAVDAPAPKRREHSTAADLALLRRHGDVRARVIAAVLVPFAVYTAVMVTIGRLDATFLFWIWIPLISAGVLAGVFLDIGHKRHPGGG